MSIVRIPLHFHNGFSKNDKCGEYVLWVSYVEYIEYHPFSNISYRFRVRAHIYYLQIFRHITKIQRLKVDFNCHQ